MVTIFTSITPELVATMPEGPTEDVRRASRWLMMALATGRDGGAAQGWVQGADVYGITAVISVEGARRLVADRAKPGVLAPAEAYDPVDFLDFLGAHGVSWKVRTTE